MPPKAKTAKKGAKNARKKPRGQRMRAATGSGDVAGFQGHMSMVVDPCSSMLTKSIYSGTPGVVTRHTTSGQLSANAGDQTLVLVYYPGAFKAYFASLVSGSTVITLTPATSGVPGYSFLNNTSSQARVVGSCLQIHWNGTEMARAGTVGYGVIQAGLIPGTPITQDMLFTLCPHKTRVVPGELEVVWNPAAEDESYAPCDGTTVENFNDRNAIIFTYQGPAGAVFGWSMTTIYEWQPRVNQGQPAPPSVRSSLPAAVPHINNTLSRIKDWGHGAAHMAANAAAATSAVYSGATNTYKLLKGVSGMVSTVGVPLLL